jgi:hypothetical protein
MPGYGRQVPKKRGRRKPTHRGSPSPRRSQTREPDLLRDVAEALAADDPLHLLGYASILLAATDSGRRGSQRTGGPSQQEFVQTLLEVDVPETTALVLVMGELSGDELLQARVRAGVAEREYDLPEWVTALPRSRPSEAPLQVAHVLGDGDNVLLGVALPGGHGITLTIYIDHNLGTLVKDAFAVPGSPRELADQMLAMADDPDTTVTELDPADARARVVAAIELGAITIPPVETDTWPGCRPLVQWAAAMLPPGGAGYVRPEWEDAALAAVADRFFASPLAEGLDDEDAHSLLESLLWFGSGYGPGDPLRWSPTAVEILLLDFIPRKIVAEVEYLSKAPEVLRAFVRFCHAERAIRAELTDETLFAVDRYEPEYQQLIRTPRLQGPEALIAALEAYEPGQR